MAARDDVIDRHLVLDEAFEDVVEDRIGRQRILVGLVGPQFRRWCLVDDVLRDDHAGRPQRAGRRVRIAPARQRIDLHLVEVLDRVEPAIHVAVERRIADAHLALVAGRDDHRAELVGDRHQDRAARAALQVLLGDPFIRPVEHVGERAQEAVDRCMDGHDVIAAAEKPRAFLGVLEGILRGVGIRQHDAAQTLLAQRIDGQRRADCRVDPAGQAENHRLEAVLVDVVAQPQHAGAIVGFFRLRNARHRPAGAAPAVLRAAPMRDRHLLLELAHLERQRPVRIEGEGRPVKHQFVLPAQLVRIDQRQVGLDHLADHHLVAPVRLAAIIGRAVG